MPAVLRKLRPTIFEVLCQSTSSPELVDGLSPCDSLDGQMIDQSGPDLVRANHFQQQENNKVSTTNDTFGRKCYGSSKSVALQLSLESKLQTLLDTVGSMEFSSTWKDRITLAGRQYLEHTVSARRIFDKDCTGWPTPCAGDGLPQSPLPEHTNAWLRKPSPRMMKLQSWATGVAHDGKVSNRGFGLGAQVHLAHWATPKASNDGDSPTTIEMAIRKEAEMSLARQCHLTGKITKLSNVETGNRVGLNPNHSRWMMGFPLCWTLCGVLAYQKMKSKN